MSDEEIRTQHTDNPVCPHCGYVHRDSWEWDGEDGDHECDSCGEPFRWSVMVWRTWNTKLEEK